jgi:hypothetical protein
LGEVDDLAEFEQFQASSSDIGPSAHAVVAIIAAAIANADFASAFQRSPLLSGFGRHGRSDRRFVPISR